MASLKQTKIYGALEVYNGEKKVSVTVDPENYPNGIMNIGHINIDGIGVYKTDDLLEITSTISTSGITGLSALTFTGEPGTINGLKTLSFETGSITDVHSIAFGGNDSEITNLNNLDMKSEGTITFSSLTSGTVIEGTKIKFMKPIGDTTSTILDASELNIGTGIPAGITEPFKIRGSSNIIPDSSSPTVARNDRDLRIIAPTYISSGYDISYNPTTEAKELFEKNILSVIDSTLLIKSYNKKEHRDGAAVGSSIIGYEYTEDNVASFDNEKIKIYKPIYGYGDNNTDGSGGITIARDDSKEKNLTLTLSPTKISFNGKNPITIGGDGKNYGDNSNNNYKSIAIGHGATTGGDKAVAIGYDSSAGARGIAIGNEAEATTDSIAIGPNAVASSDERIVIPTGWSFHSGTGDALTSDRLEKTDIKPLKGEYTNLLMNLEPVTYRFNYREDYAVENPNPKYRSKYGIPEYDKSEHAKATKAHDRTHVGFIAQDVKAAIERCFPGNDHLDIVSIDKMDTGEFQKGEVDPGYERYYMNYTALIPVLVKSIQEQQAEIEELKAEIAKLKK